MNKYENRLKRRNKKFTSNLEERRLEEVKKIYSEMEKHMIGGREYVQKREIMIRIKGSLNTQNRVLKKILSDGWFDVNFHPTIGDNRTKWLSLNSNPTVGDYIDKEVTKSSAIVAIATVLADITDMSDNIDSMIEFYDEAKGIDFEEAVSLSKMIREAAFSLANRGDALAFTISDE